MIVRKRYRVGELLLQTWKYQLGILAAVTLVTVLDMKLGPEIRFPVVVVTVLGIALAFFIGFINNQAYERWWEARKIWGAIVNDSRSFSRMVLSFLSSELSREDDVRQLQVTLVRRHIAFLYALKERLRNETTREYEKYLADSDQERMGEQTHIPNTILLLQGQDIDEAAKANYTDVFRMTQINEMLNGFSNHMGACERIKNTPFPVFYNTLIRIAVWMFVLTFPLAITSMFGYWAIPYAWLLSSIFVLTRRSGLALMNPFGTNPSATAMASITRTIEINLLEQLGEKDIPKPVEPIRNLYLL